MKINTYLFAALLLIPSIARPMGARLRRGLYTTCKAVNIALPVLPLAVGAAMYATQTTAGSIINQKPDAPEIVKEFAHENIKTIGINPPNLRIKQYPSFASYKQNTILIKDCDCDLNEHFNLINLLKKQNDNTLTMQEKEKLNLYRAIIQHEGTHLKNKDPRNTEQVRNIALCAANYLPFYNFYQSKILKKNVPIKIAPSIIKSLALIPSGLGKLIMTPLIMSAYSIYSEQRADDGISDDIDVLQAAANSFKERAKEEDLQQQGDPKHPMRRRIDNFLSIIKEGHPSDTQRAQRFEERIAKLKEQNAQKSEVHNKS